jgi:hypothetical protein
MKVFSQDSMYKSSMIFIISAGAVFGITSRFEQLHKYRRPALIACILISVLRSVQAAASDIAFKYAKKQ